MYWFCKARRSVIPRWQSVFHAFATLVDPTVLFGPRSHIGEGCIICAGSIITTDVIIGKHVIINLDCTLGHDAVLGDFVTLYPSVNVSGSTQLHECVEFGTGSQIIQGIEVGAETIVGAGAVVIRDLPGSCTAVGVPARVIKESRDSGVEHNEADS